MLNTTELERLRAQHLVETEWLAQHLNDPDLRIVDIRGYVKWATDVTGKAKGVYIGAPEEYAQGHIPGAIYLDWATDTVDTDNPLGVQVAGADKLAKVFGEAGIGDDNLVLAYDASFGSHFATWLWWVFRYVGHTNLRVLNGGFKKWEFEHHPLTTEVPKFLPTTFTPKLDRRWKITAEEILPHLTDKQLHLLDVRDAGRFSGATKVNGRAGHIPGASLFLREEMLEPTSGTFKFAPEMTHAVKHLVNIAPEDQIVTYCATGVAATVALFSLSMLGYSNLTNYNASWNEWGEREDWPVE